MDPYTQADSLYFSLYAFIAVTGFGDGSIYCSASSKLYEVNQVVHRPPFWLQLVN